MNGREFVWSVDPAVSRLAVAFAEIDGDAIEATTLITRTDEREGARLGLLDRQLRIAARQWAAKWPPAAVFVEQSSSFADCELAYVVGVVQAALFETLAVPVWTIRPGRWKREALGRSRAPRLAVEAFVDELGLDVDAGEGRAVAIAWAGRSLLAAASSEAAA